MAEVIGLGFVFFCCYQPLCLANRVDLGFFFCFINFPILPPSPPSTESFSTHLKGSVEQALLQTPWCYLTVMMIRGMLVALSFTHWKKTVNSGQASRIKILLRTEVTVFIHFSRALFLTGLVSAFWLFRCFHCGSWPRLYYLFPSLFFCFVCLGWQLISFVLSRSVSPALLHQPPVKYPIFQHYTLFFHQIWMT